MRKFAPLAAATISLCRNLEKRFPPPVTRKRQSSGQRLAVGRLVTNFIQPMMRKVKAVVLFEVLGAV